MVQGFYTLEEAAKRLGLPPHELNQMAQRHQIRGFQDRGTWRFRTQDIEEMARQRGLGSDVDLPIADSSSSSELEVPPASAPAGPGKSEDVFPFKLDAGSDVEFSENILDAPAAKKPPGSDSDVRLVSAGSSLDLKVDSDSDVKVATAGPKVESDVKTKQSSKVLAGKSPQVKAPVSDSGSKIVADSDSDVKLVEDSAPHASKTPRPTRGHPGDSNILLVDDDQLGEGRTQTKTDSDVRLEGDSGTRKSGKMGRGAGTQLSREIDLDEELLKAEGSSLLAAAPVPKAGSTPASSDFDLEPGLDSPTEEISLDLSPSPGDSAKKPSKRPPSDAGISLEPESDSSGEEMSFELAIDEASATPGQKRRQEPVDSSSEFELSIEDDAGLSPLDEQKDDQNILETDFEVPALAEDSSAEAPVADEGSSEFELAIDEEDLAADSDIEVAEDSAVEEGEATEPTGVEAAESLQELEGEEVESLFAEPGVEEGEVISEEEAVYGAPMLAGAAAAAPAPWGALPTLFLFPTTIVMILVGFLLFEMLRSVWSYDQPSFVSGQISEMIGNMTK